MRRLLEGAFRHSAARGNVGKRPPLPPPPAFLLPSTSAPRPRPCFPDPLFSRLGAAGWGLPGEEVPLRHSERKGFSPHPPPPSALRSEVLLAPPPFPSRPNASFLPRTPPQLPSLPLPGLHRLFARLPSHLATSKVSGKRVGEADVRGRRNHVASAARRTPREPFRPRPLGPAAEEGVSRRHRRAKGQPQLGGRPLRVAGSPRAHNPARALG